MSILISDNTRVIHLIAKKNLKLLIKKKKNPPLLDSVVLTNYKDDFISRMQVVK